MRRVLVILFLPAALVFGPASTTGEPAAQASVLRTATSGDPSLQRLTLAPAPGTTFKVVADYDNSKIHCLANRRLPLRARYAGNLEVVRSTDGTLALVNELSFGDYLDGLAEVPRSWPAESLKAQVIAARSYALSHVGSGSSPIGYDLCSTDACQVYRGLEVSQGAFGDAWRRAVQETTGEVLVSHGAPIEAFYFSTSWGRTVSNTEGFGGGTPLPYLKPTTGEDDDAPLAHWHSEIPLADLAPILKTSGDWTGPAITSVTTGSGSITFGGGATRHTLSLTDFRFDMNRQSDCLFPQRYPPRTATGHLPQTIPSPHFALQVKAGRVVIDGRGWGHGVGMSQYGARSLAARGRSSSDILAHFYGGLRPVRVREPGALRVLVGNDAVKITIEASGAFTAHSNDGVVHPGRSFAVQGGVRMKILRAGRTPVLTVEPLAPETQRTYVGGVASISYQLPVAARVQGVLLRDGKEIMRTPEVSQEDGANQMTFSLTDANGEPVSPGLYEATIEASDGIDRVRAQPVLISAQVLPEPVTAAPPKAAGGTNARIALILGAMFGIAVLVLASRRLRHKKLNRT